MRGTVLISLISLALAGPGSAQVPTGDSAWAQGNYSAARQAYQRALAEDSTSVRSYYRLAVLLAWDGKLDSALVLLGKARSIEPQDPDVRLWQARVRSWDGQYALAIAEYDSLLAGDPDNQEAALGRAQSLAWANQFSAADSAYTELIARDSTDMEARVGQAQVSAWSGDLGAAVEQYQAALAIDPSNQAARIGLARVNYWLGRDREALAGTDSVLAINPGSREAQELQYQVRTALAPRVSPEVGWTHDSDDNTTWWETLSTSFSPAERISAYARVTWGQASDPTQDASDVALVGGASYSLERALIRASVGVTMLSPASGAFRAPFTFGLGGTYRFTSSTVASIGFAHGPFYDTALLIGSGLNLDALDVSGSTALPWRVSLDAGVSETWISDGNNRTAGTLVLTRPFPHRLSGGLFARVMGYAFKGVGYFSPDFYYTAEVRGAYTYTTRLWDARASGGLGFQQVGSGGSLQSEWHLEGLVARRFGVANEIGLTAGITNSLASSSTGAYRYATAALTVRLGL